MARAWRHEVDPSWMKVRHKYLTASEIKSLMPEYRRYIRAKRSWDFIPGFCGLWAEKTGNGEDDILSFNAAARGHIMEPYAIADWNKQALKEWHVEHWDDAIIANGKIGFSPDAMDIPQNTLAREIMVDSVTGNLVIDGAEVESPTRIVEVKSYNPSSHLKKSLEDPLKIEECYQIATAFHVLPKLEIAHLLFYCPTCVSKSMFSYKYTREMLSEYLEQIDDIAKLWDQTCNWCMKNVKQDFKASWSEEDIYNDWLESEQSPGTVKDKWLLR